MPDAQEFLELLAREAAAVEFDGPVLRARARGEPAPVLAELERSRTLALRVRALLARRHRREVELTGLFETAGDLAALREVDSVLQAIVRRARQLLGTDVAYLTLHDEDRGDTYMRVTDGAVSAWFRGLRLAFGAGLGGLVAQTGVPYVTSNYFTDERFHHTPDIDGAVREEGLIAILGVPLALGSRVVGVLFAANRSERPFAREEIALLSSLAAHAAVALDSARLLEETRAALAELANANAMVRAHSAAVERAVSMHDRFTEVVLRGGGVDDVALAVTDVLGGALVVLDAHGHRLASAGDVRDLPAGTVATAVSASRATGRAAAGDGLWVVAVVAGSEYLGALVHLREPVLVEADQRILERAALVTALLLLFRRSVAEAESRVRGEFLDDLLTTPHRDPGLLAERASRLGFDLEAPYVVVVARVDGDPERAAFSASHYASGRGALSTTHGGDVVLLLPCHHGRPSGPCPEHARDLARELGAGFGRPVTAGSAGPGRGTEGLRRAYAEAVRCVEALVALGRTGDAAGSHELGYVGLLLSDRRDVAGFVGSVLGAVLAYDQRRGTALIDTLDAFFATSGSLARTADELHVHVNTVGQRLERLGVLLGEDWQAPDRRLDLQLALRLHHLSVGG